MMASLLLKRLIAHLILAAPLVAGVFADFLFTGQLDFQNFYYRETFLRD